MSTIELHSTTELHEARLSEARLQAADATAPSTAVAAARPRLRLTRRGRVVLTALAATPLVVVALLLGLNGGMATATSGEGTPLRSVTVDAGQSLWALASELAPSEDPREVIAVLAQANQLDSVEVVPGQRILVPASLAAE